MAVSVKELSQDKITKMSMVDVASIILTEEKQPLSFLDTFNKVAALKEWDNDMKKNKVAQFYTDLNVDARFITNGSNTWGLKRWYKLDEISADLTNSSIEVLEDEFEDPESSFLKAPGFEVDIDEDDEEAGTKMEPIGFEDPEEAEEGFDDEYADEEDEDFGEDYDEDEDED